MLTKWPIVAGLVVACLLVARGVRAEDCACDAAAEVARIRSHLLHVEQVLRARDTSSLSERQRIARASGLAHLRAYIDHGSFPTNHDFPGRRAPYFVDADGVHCAVAHLVAQTDDRELMNVVVAGFNNARVHDMPLGALLAWATANGFTVDELARIQPAYCGYCAGGWACGKYFCDSSNGPGTTGTCNAYEAADGTGCDRFYLHPPSKCFEQICMSGECVEARPIDCDDGDPSTADSCDEEVGCVNEPLANRADESTPMPHACSLGEPVAGDEAAAWLAMVLLALARARRDERP